MNFTIAPVVEGYGDDTAVPVLLRRMAPELRVASPVRQGRGVLMKPDGLIRAVQIAASNLRGAGAVLVLFDEDRECAVEIADTFRRRLQTSLPHIPCRVALAVRGFESWIVGGDPYYAVDNADNAGDVKGRIKERYGYYKKTADQPRLIARADLERLRLTSRSFRHLDKVVNDFRRLAQDSLT